MSFLGVFFVVYPDGPGQDQVPGGRGCATGNVRFVRIVLPLAKVHVDRERVGESSWC